MIIERRSPLTGQVNSMDLDVTREQLDEMALPGHARLLLQAIFPNLSNAEREFIKTGYTAEDWERIFPPEEA